MRCAWRADACVGAGRSLRLPILWLLLVTAWWVAGDHGAVWAQAEAGPTKRMSRSASSETDLAAPHAIEWSHSTPLPRALVGHFAGIVTWGEDGEKPLRRALVVAGGTGFEAVPGGSGRRREWYDAVAVLPEGAAEWSSGFALARSLAHGVSIATADHRLVCIGGGDDRSHSREVIALGWDGENLSTQALPPLPRPCAFMAGALVGEAIYVAAGQESPSSPAPFKAFWRLALKPKENGEWGWEELAPWPGEARTHAIAAALGSTFFLAGGSRAPGEAEVAADDFLREAYRYSPSPQGGKWERTADLPYGVAAAPAHGVGSTHVFVFGTTLAPPVSAATRARENATERRYEVLAYEAVTDTWRAFGSAPRSLAAAPLLMWRHEGREYSFLFAGGRGRDDQPTQEAVFAEIASDPATFQFLDYAALVAYLLAMIAMGLYFARRGKTTQDFFLAGRRIPWWAATLSIFSTQLSAITFMAIPGKAFATNWVSMLMNLGIVLSAPLVVFWFLPFFRRLNVTTAYEYLERRFSAPIRLYGSLAFIVYQLGRMGIVLFLPSLALSTVTGFDVYACIVILGVLCTIYTVLGGIEAVVWTDVLQTFVLLGGALLCLGVVITSLDGGLSEIFAVAHRSGKLQTIEWSGGLTSTVYWVVIVGGLFTQLIPYCSDQSVIQRFLTTPTEKAAARSIWIHAVMVVPSSLLFFGVGTALFVFYQSRPELLNPTSASSDDIFPWFIANELPAGLSGIVIAGLFAATMSSVDSSMNSIATVLVTDFYRRFRPHADDHRCLNLARSLTIIIGVFATAAAVLIGLLNAESLWDLFLKNAGLLGSSLAGIFLLGVLTQRANTGGTVIGALCSIGTLAWIQRLEPQPINGYLYAVVGILVCVGVGYAASWLFPAPGERIEGLTVATVRPPSD